MSDSSITLFARSAPTYHVYPISITVHGVGKWVLLRDGLHCNLPFQAKLSGDNFTQLTCQPSEGKYTVNHIDVNENNKTVQVRAGLLPTTFLPWTDLGFTDGQSPRFKIITVQGQLSLQVEDVDTTIDSDFLDVTCAGNSLLNLAPGDVIKNIVQVKATSTGKSKLLLNIQCQQLDAVVWGTSSLSGVQVTDVANLLARGVSTMSINTFPNAIVKSQATGKSDITIGGQSQIP